MADDIKTLKEAAESANRAAKAISDVTESLSEQFAVIQSLNEAYDNFLKMKSIPVFSDMTKSLSDLKPEIEEFIKNTKDTSKEIKLLSDDLTDIDKTVETLTGRMKDLSKIYANKDTFATKSFDDMADSVLSTKVNLDAVNVATKNTVSNMSSLSSASSTTSTSLLGMITGLALMSKNSKATNGLLKMLSGVMSGVFATAAGGVLGAIQGVISAFQGFLAIGKGVGALFTNILGWAFQLGAAIISIPVRFLGGLVEMASQMNLGMAEYYRKLEEVRDKFGNFRIGQSLAIKEMQKGFAKTTETGLNAWRIYGNLAERLQAITELVEGLGATWGKFSDEFAADGYVQAKRIDEFRMGLGFSQEQLKSVMMLTSASGKSAGKQLTDITKHVKAYASALKISHKVIARDIADAIKDAGKFGGSTVDAIARASAYARGLGHELKEIAGVLDAFETFDTAAEGAAKLAQSFGATVDAFKLVSAQSPDEMIQSLRDSMFAAGKTADQMNRQELKLLSSQTGLSEEVARSVFSMKNQGRSVEDLMKIQEKQEDAQTTQAKALKSLAEDIRRLVKEMEPLQKSFVSMFVDGMKKGATRSKEFLGLMMEIRQGLMLTWREGFKLGQVLIKEVPGLKMLFEGLHAFFQPSKFQLLAKKMRFILLDFFKGTTGVSGLLHSAQQAFYEFFTSENPAARKMLEGAKMLMKRVSQVFAEGISWVGKQMTEGIRFIIDVISGKQKIGDVGSLGKSGMGFLGEIFMPIIKSIMDVAPQLASAVLDLTIIVAKKAWEFIKTNKTVQSTMHNVGLAMVGVLAASIVSRAALGMLMGALTSATMSGISKLSSGGLSKKISDAGSKVASSTPKLGKGVEAAGNQTSGIVEGWVKAAIAAKQVTLKDIGMLFLVLAALGAGLAVAGVAFAMGIKGMYAQLKGIKMTELIPVFAALGTLITSAVIVATSISLIGKFADPKSLLLGGAALGLVTLGIIGITYLVGKVAKSFQESNISPTMLKATGELMNTMAKTMLLMVPILLASAAIGATLMGPQGLLIAAASAIGFAAISTGLAGLTAVTLEVVEILNKMPRNAGLAEKSEAFTNILNSISNMVSIIGSILKEFSPGLSDFINIFSGGKITDRVESATKFIGQLLPSINKLVDKVKDSLLSLVSEDKNIVKGGEVFASIFASIASFTKSIIPSSDLLMGETNDMGMFSQKITKITGSSTEYVKTVSKSVSMFMSEIMKVINQLSGMNVSKDMMQYGIPAFSGMLSSIASIMSAIVPNADLIKQFKSIESNEEEVGLITTTIKKSVEKLDVNGLKSMMNFITNNFKSLLQTMTSGAFQQFLATSAELIKTPAQLKSVEAVGGVMSSLGNIIKSIAEAVKMPALQSISGENINVNFRATDINKVLQGLAGEQGGIKQIFDTIMSLTSNLGNTKDINSRLQVLSNVFAGIGQVAAFIKTVSESSKGEEDLSYIKSVKANIVEKGLMPALEAVQQMADSVNQMNEALSNISLGKKTVQTGLQNVANAMGVGGKASYNIQNKPINIHLEIQVEMKAAEVEKVIVFRKESIIRDQLRWIRKSEPGRDAFQNAEMPSDTNTRYVQHVTG